jgi:regulator of RNase E activity RraA
VSGTDTLVERLAGIDTPTLSNAIEKLGVRNRISGFCSREMRCLFPELGTMCGYAVTAEGQTMNADEPGALGEPFFDLCRAIQRSPGPTVVVFTEVGPLPEFSAHCGEVMATTFKRLGSVGVVSDSAVRDLPEVRAMGVRYFAPGAVASHGNFKVVRAGMPVTVCGMQVRPGDLLHGDGNGLISVPEEGRERLPELAAEVTAGEKKVMDYIRGDDFTVDGLKELITH